MFFLLDMSNFIPQYKKDTIYSYEGSGKDNLKKFLQKHPKDIVCIATQKFSR